MSSEDRDGERSLDAKEPEETTQSPSNDDEDLMNEALENVSDVI
jgi:hypothetical protein